MSDKRKFKISGITLKTGTGTDAKVIKIKDFDTPDQDFSDKEKDVLLTDHEVEDDKGTKYKLNITFKGKKGWYYDNTEDLEVKKGTTETQTFEIGDKGKAVGASYHKLMTFGSIGLVVVVIAGFVWWWMSSSKEEEKEEEGL